MTSKIHGQSSQAEDAMLSALLYLHRRKQERARQHQPNPRYARILEHFQERARRLCDERIVTEELLERLFEGAKALPPRAPRQELVITGATGTTAVGRIQVRNATAQSATFELVVGAAVEGDREVMLRCDPPRGTLTAGAAQLVRVAAELGGLRAGQSATLPLECRWSTGRDYLWLTIRAEGRDR